MEIIGRLNDTAALASISLLLPFTTILMAIGNLFGMGGSTLFSRLLGGDDESISCAAIATVLGNAAAVAYYFICIWRADNQLSVLPKYFRLETQMLKEIFSVGSSAMLLDILLIISSLMFNYYALKYGDYVLAGFGISQKLVQIVDLSGMGLYMGYGSHSTYRCRLWCRE